MINELKFYREFLSKSVDDITKIKLQSLKECIYDDKIYKFIAFTDDDVLNSAKLLALKNDKLWFSHYIYLNDATEFQIKYDVKKVLNKTGRDKRSLRDTIEMMKEIYDICSFSYENSNYMWNNYANNENGICLTFNVLDYDMLFPVDYIDKWKINYSKLIIDAFKKIDKGIDGMYYSPLAILPYVTKNPVNENFISSDEKEVRILYPTFEDGSFNNGVVMPKIKQELLYRGCNVSYDFCKLKLYKITVGNGCEGKIKQQITQIASEKGVICCNK